MPQGHHRHLNRSQIVRRYAIRRGSKGESVRFHVDDDEWQPPTIPRQETSIDTIPSTVICTTLEPECLHHWLLTSPDEKGKVNGECVKCGSSMPQLAELLVDGRHETRSTFLVRRHRPGPRPKGIVFSCEICGQERYVRPYFAKSRPNKFCSRTCMAKSAEWRQSVGQRNGRSPSIPRPTKERARYPSTIIDDSVISFIQKLVPHLNQPDIREDVIQECYLSLLQGDNSLESLPSDLYRLINKGYAQTQSKYSLSLNTLVTEKGEYIDALRGEAS